MQTHALSSFGLRFSHALFLALICLSFASARATASEIIVKTDSLPGSGTPLPGLSPGTRFATLLTAPIDGTIVGVQILWGSLSGTAPPAQETAIRISSYDPLVSPFPAATLATIDSPTLIDGAVNGIAEMIGGASQSTRKVQTGYVRNYALAVAFGVVVILAFLAFRLFS